MRQSILIIEDNKQIANWIKIYFDRAGFSTEVAYDGKTGLGMARSFNPDLIVLDLMLPQIDGIEVCNILRLESDVPIIMLTAKGTQQDRLRGLEIGADDYIVKPFDPEELVARGNAVLRRYKGNVQQKLHCGRLILYEGTQNVYLDGQKINMSLLQFSILEVFMRHPNQVLTRDQLISLAFNNNFNGADRAIDTHIRRLRKLIHRKDYYPIQTIYGKGYKLLTKEN